MVQETVRQHFRRFFAGHRCTEHTWDRGPARRDLPDLRIAEFAPGPQTGLWVYATIGASGADTDPRLEFLLLAPAQDMRHTELATMTAWYHQRHRLGLGHTFPIGEPWLPGSRCTDMLVSFPYPFGADLWTCKLPAGDVRILWLLPITEAEKQYKVSAGLEALEQRFDDCSIRYWELERPSVVVEDEG